MNIQTDKQKAVQTYHQILDNVNIYQNGQNAVKGEKDATLNVLQQQYKNSAQDTLNGVQTKMDNKLIFLKEKKNIMNLSNKINDSLSEGYDEDFFKKYDQINELNSKISTQDTIINMNNEHASKYSKMTKILKIMMSALVFIILIFIIYSISGNKNILVYGCAIVVILTLIYIGVTIFKKTLKDSVKTFDKMAEATGRGMVKAVALNLLSPSVYKCPKECKKKNHHHKGPESHLTNVSSTNPDYNSSFPTDIVGDIPSTLGYNFLGPNPSDVKIEKESIERASRYDNKPKGAYTGIVDYKTLKDPNALNKELKRKVTCNTCKWDGGEDHGNDHLGSDMVKSTIPCDHLPGYSFQSKSLISASECK